MKTSKEPDCVAMKRLAQERLMAEYEANKHQYGSFAEFLHVTAERSEWVRSIRAKVRGPKVRRGGR